MINSIPIPFRSPQEIPISGLLLGFIQLIIKGCKNTALIDGIRKFAMDVRDLEIDLIDRINPFGEAYAILSKTMNEESLKQVAIIIAGKKTNITIEEARELAKRAKKFKDERGRLPSLSAQDPWEKRMAEGVAALQRYAADKKNE